jgi:hypothetical protein
VLQAEAVFTSNLGPKKTLRANKPIYTLTFTAFRSNLIPTDKPPLSSFSRLAITTLFTKPSSNRPTMSVFETVARFSIQHVGPKTTYEIFTSLVLLYACFKQLQIFLSSIHMMAYLMIPSISAIVVSLTSSSIYMRIGCPIIMLVIIKFALDAEIASNRCVGY